MIELCCKKPSILINYLNEFEGLNYNKLQVLFRKKEIKVNGIRVDKNFKIKIGDNIKIFCNADYFYKIQTIYEDENVLIVDKPKKLEVVSENREISLINLINSNFYVVHRIDFNTEGLVVIAKNEKSKIILDEAFKNGKVLKNYITICKNNPIQNEMEFKDYLIKKDDCVKIVSKNVKDSKTVITQIKVLKSKSNFSLLEVNLLTGRTHQIRAHLAYHNLYVLGDDKYGDFKTNKFLNLKSQILKCCKLQFKFNNNCELSYLNNKIFLADTSEIINYFDKL